MTLYKLVIILSLLLFQASIQGFINKTLISSRGNKILKKHNYIICGGDIHEGLYNLNNEQIKQIKSLVYNSDPKQTLFLVEDIASMQTNHPLFNNVVEAINETYSNPNMSTKIPIVTLVNYALANKKNAINLDHRAHTLLQTIFHQLLICYIQKHKFAFLPQQYQPSDYKISLREIGFALNNFLKNCENDYIDIRTKLKTLEDTIQDHPENLNQINDFKCYIDFYNSFSETIREDKAYADSLITKNVDLITHLVNEYMQYKNINKFNLESLKDIFNFNIYAGSTFLTKMLNFGSYAVELKALKLIIENLNSKPKIFIFAGQKHIDKLNEILEKMSFKKIYEKTQTKNIPQIYAHISEHIQRAESFNKINNNYILKIKQNLKPIDPTFFKVCQKRHLRANDFKNLR